MKTMTVLEARNNFSRTLKAAQRDVVVVTRNGRAVAAIQAIGDHDFDDLLLERSPKFWEHHQEGVAGPPDAAVSGSPPPRDPSGGMRRMTSRLTWPRAARIITPPCVLEATPS